MAFHVRAAFIVFCLAASVVRAADVCPAPPKYQPPLASGIAADDHRIHLDSDDAVLDADGNAVLNGRVKVSQDARSVTSDSVTYDPATGGPFLRSSEIKATIKPYTQAQIECIGEMAQYIYSAYGRFPARFPTILLRVYTQAHHLDREYYDTFYGAGAYLHTHTDHMERWHPSESQT